MDASAAISLANLVVSGVLLATFWNWVNHRLEQYRYLDEAYNELLKGYFEHPRFGQRDLTDKYAQAFAEEECWKYHYFAMRVHTFLETIFDFSKIPFLPRRPIPAEWKQIFEHHAKLHSAWLRDHRDLHEAGYIERVVG